MAMQQPAGPNYVALFKRYSHEDEQVLLYYDSKQKVFELRVRWGDTITKRAPFREIENADTAARHILQS
jgi:hypothetical protein